MAARGSEIPAFPFWGLDYRFWSFKRLLVIDLLREQSSILKNLPTLYDIPILFAEICGIVVAMRQSGSRFGFVVDDGTGAIKCQMFIREDHEDPQSFKAPVQLGDRIRVRGKVAIMQGQRVLFVDSHVNVDDANEQVLSWLQAVHLRRTVYSMPPATPEHVLQEARQLPLRTLGWIDPVELHSYAKGILRFLRERFKDCSGFYHRDDLERMYTFRLSDVPTRNELGVETSPATEEDTRVAMQLLLDSGHAVQVDEDYVFIAERGVLGRSVLQCLRETEVPMPASRIADAVRGKPLCQGVEPWRVAYALLYLTEDGEILESGERFSLPEQ